jgi:hypothetical protein
LTQTSLIDLGYQFNFYARPKRHLSDSEGATRVHSFFVKYFGEEFGSTIGYQVLLRECGSAVHQNHQLHNALDLVKIADSRIQCA